MEEPTTVTEANDVEKPESECAPVHPIVRQSLPLDTIICGDNCDVLGTFPRECIDLVVTSPPYDDLRKYGGDDWDFYGVAWQLCRVLKPGGVIMWNVNDQTIDGDETGTSWAQANHFRTLGLKLWDTMIWDKPWCQYGDTASRYAGTWEYCFVLSKGQPKTVNIIKDRKNNNQGATRKSRTDRRVTNGDGWAVARAKPHTIGEFGPRKAIWTYQVGGKSECGTGHPAVFPDGLARDHIRSWSDEGEIVLDPFNGSGTTTKMARELGRRYIGIDVNEEYCEIARQRIAQQLLF